MATLDEGFDFIHLGLRQRGGKHYQEPIDFLGDGSRSVDLYYLILLFELCYHRPGRAAAHGLEIQAAEQPPRYVAISKVRQAMKTASIEEQQVEGLDLSGGPVVSRMYQPESGERAEMIEGDEEEVAARLVEIFKEQGLL